MAADPEMIENVNKIRSLSERLLQGAIEKSISKELGILFRELGDFTKEMSEPDKQEAKRMVLKMMAKATNEFYAKMRARIDESKE